MEKYLFYAAGLNFTVKLLLILASSRLCGGNAILWRVILGALMDAVFSVLAHLVEAEASLLPLLRVIQFLLVALVGFGLSERGLRCLTVYFILTMALEGMSLGLQNTRMATVMLAAGSLFFLCVYLAADRSAGNKRITVELDYNGKKLTLSGIADTGNLLRDPVTGKGVLIINAASAEALTGLSCEELSQPVRTLSEGKLPGLRLIPYHTAGQSGGMLLALRIRNVKINDWKGSSLVAFAPVDFRGGENIQALAGGYV